MYKGVRQGHRSHPGASVDLAREWHWGNRCKYQIVCYKGGVHRRKGVGRMNTYPARNNRKDLKEKLMELQTDSEAWSKLHCGVWQQGKVIPGGDKIVEERGFGNRC